MLLIGLNRPHKRNAFTLEMLAELSRAYGLLESDDDLRVGVLFAHGEHFTGGLDLADVAPAVTSGKSPFPDEGRNPFRIDGTWTKPIVAAAQGRVITAGIELLLAADILRIASADALFSQVEVRRGIYPFGGATVRFPQVAGWGNAMRWILTGDEFDAQEALRIGLIQEIASDRTAALERARTIARTIAEDAAPLGVRAIVASAHRARDEGDPAAFAQLIPDAIKLSTTADAAEGVMSFIERRAPLFHREVAHRAAAAGAYRLVLMAVDTYVFDDDGCIPNSPLPVLVFHEIGAARDATACERLFAQNGWRGAWRNGIYSFHHFHSTAHEALGIVAGSASVMLGGPSGRRFELQRGDVLVLPAGTGHCKLASDRLLVVGAYPDGIDWDVRRGDPRERAEVLANINSVHVPHADPVHGVSGPVSELWRRSA